MQNNEPLPLAEALRLLRARHRLRQYQLAEKAGITKAMLSSFETGKTRPSLGSLLSVLAGMGSDLGELQDAIDLITGKRPAEAKLDETTKDSRNGESVEVRVPQLAEVVPLLKRIATALESSALLK